MPSSKDSEKEEPPEMPPLEPLEEAMRIKQQEGKSGLLRQMLENEQAYKKKAKDSQK